MSDFKRLDFAKIPGGAIIACERLPELPAIYSFFAPTPVLPRGEKGAFLAALRDLIEQRASPTLRSKIGSLHNVTLDNYSSLTPTKSDTLHDLADDQEFRDEIAIIIESCMPLRSPLYVGQTSSLKSRIKQHLHPSSPLSVRLRSTDLQIEQSTLCYRLMPDLDVFKTPESLQLAEEIVTRILRPGYVARIG
jgi:hypothetical protein